MASSANIVGAGVAEAHGYKISFMDFLKLVFNFNDIRKRSTNIQFYQQSWFSSDNLLTHIDYRIFTTVSCRI